MTELSHKHFEYCLVSIAVNIVPHMTEMLVINFTMSNLISLFRMHYAIEFGKSVLTASNKSNFLRKVNFLLKSYFQILLEVGYSVTTVVNFVYK